MGGYGSTRWGGHTRKTTVQECHILHVNDFAKVTLADCAASGALVWYSQSLGAVRARLVAKNVLRRMGIEPQPSDQPYGQRFRVTRTPCNYGGWRYWLHCPSCGRRAVKLYKPYFGSSYSCRPCHDLTYTSAQEAHHYDRAAKIGVLLGRADQLTRLQNVACKRERARPGSKRERRLFRLLVKLMNSTSLDEP